MRAIWKGGKGQEYWLGKTKEESSFPYWLIHKIIHWNTQANRAKMSQHNTERLIISMAQCIAARSNNMAPRMHKSYSIFKIWKEVKSILIHRRKIGSIEAKQNVFTSFVVASSYQVKSLNISLRQAFRELASQMS